MRLTETGRWLTYFDIMAIIVCVFFIIVVIAFGINGYAWMESMHYQHAECVAQCAGLGSGCVC